MVLEDKEDVRVMGKIHGLLGVPEEPFEPKKTYSRAYGEGSSRRVQMLKEGRTPSDIARSVEFYLIGFISGSNHALGDKAHDSGWWESFRRAALHQ